MRDFTSEGEQFLRLVPAQLDLRAFSAAWSEVGLDDSLELFPVYLQMHDRGLSFVELHRSLVGVLGEAENFAASG